MDRQAQALITSEAFTAAMTDRWTFLGNISSPKLQSLWSTIADTFDRAIANHAKPHSPWLVLEPPTGTGKTQGLCVYAALAIVANRTATTPLGMLVVTRTIKQANKVAADIRALAGLADEATAVVAKHSEHKATTDQMRAAEVLVITHSAYTNTLEGLVKDTTQGSRWTDYVVWSHGPRRLTVIDEALAGIVEEHQITAENIRTALAFVNDKVRNDFPTQVAALERVRDVLTEITRKTDTDGADKSSRIVWRAVADGRTAFPNGCSMDGMREALRGHRYDLQVLRKDSPLDRQRMAMQTDATLAAAEAILARWAYYHKIGTEATFNASQLLIPPGLPGVVVLDATASQNVLWELLDGRAERIATVNGARHYGNVTMHVAHAIGTGKDTMKQRGVTRIPRVLSQLADTVPHDRRVLFVTHKANEHLALSWEHPFAAFSVAHWGDLDGRNDWHDHDTVVLFGLPFRPDTWANNMFFALQGLPKSNAWMTDPQWRGYPDIRQEMIRRQMAVDIIQAMNRVRCRRVVDVRGGCNPTTVYAVLPPGEFGDQLRDSLCEEMPGATTVPWEFTLDGAAQRIRRGSCHEALLAFMRNRLPGETSMSKVREELSLTPRALRDLMATLRDPTHTLTAALSAIGVMYRATGAGRNGRSWLVKV